MPRKIGYGDFTPARKAALKKAQLASAKARRKHNSETRHRRKKRNIVLGAAAAAGAAAAIGIGVGVAAAKKREFGTSEGRVGQGFDSGPPMSPEEIKAENARIKEHYAKQDAKIAALKKAAGPTHLPADSQEQWDARIELYGDGAQNVIGEISAEHGGRPEIFPTLPTSEVLGMYTDEALSPSYSVLDNNPDQDYVVLYHRTGGGVGPDKDTEAQAAKASILKSQRMSVKNRDEQRMQALVGRGVNAAIDAAVKGELVWFSDRLNESNTRAAFGEHVVQVKMPKAIIKELANQGGGAQSFGKLSPSKESWVAVPTHIINHVLSNFAPMEDVPADQIKPPPERKFRAPR